MSGQEISDAENDTQSELAAWELLREARRERDEAISDRDIARLEVEEISNDLKDARNKIWRLEKQIEGLNNFANERYEEIQSVRKERDEAREELEEIAEYGTEEINAAVELRQKLASALIERDEARSECKALWVMVDTEKKKTYTALRERDEARELADRYRVAFAALIDEWAKK